MERFLSFVELLAFDAQSMVTAMEAYLKEREFDKVMCVAQSYDGASVMSGVHGGVQTLFRNNHPAAIYVHCHGHDLNLVIVHTCSSIPEVIS